MLYNRNIIEVLPIKDNILLLVVKIWIGNFHHSVCIKGFARRLTSKLAQTKVFVVFVTAFYNYGNLLNLM